MFVNSNLTLDAKGIDVFIFKKLVYKELGLPTNDSIQDVVIRFDRDLYDKALSLPAAKTVTLNYLNEASLYLYGKFTGGNTYKDFNGTLAKSNANPISGWVSVDKTSGKYAIIMNNSTKTIINLADFSPECIVEDFTPLYDKLRYSDTSDEDIQSVSSIEATYTDEASIYVQNEDTQINQDQKASWQRVLALLNKSRVVDVRAPKNIESAFTYAIPVQVSAKQQDKVAENTSALNDIQAIIYDMPNGSTDINKSITRLYSYQQPENISYTAAASFDATPTRGTQQPFQLYNNANAIELSFNLRWHIDEVRTFAKGDGTSYSLQEIADIAEDFTRPWEFGNSITPKLVKVILPGISEIGYIVNASITYNGDLTGDFATGSGVVDSNFVSSNSIAGAHSYTTNYHFTQLEINFSLLVVKDIKLLQQNQAPSKAWQISSTNSYGPNSNGTTQSLTSDSDNSTNESEPENEVAAEVDEEPIPYYSAEKQQCLTPKAVFNQGVKDIKNAAGNWWERVKASTMPEEQTYTPKS
jgi:hypothetical protein